MQSPKTRALVVGLIIFVGLFFSLGKIRYAFNPIIRYMRLQQYLATVKQDNTIDPEKFWEFRDFYAATTSSFKSQNIRRNKPFLTFNTSYFTSADSLLQNPPPITPPLASEVDMLVFQDTTSVLYQTNSKLHIRFIKSQSEMLKANGFFRYFGVNLEPYKDYVWYNETIINL